MGTHGSDEARVIPLRPAAAPKGPAGGRDGGREPLWRDLVGEVLRRERRAQGRTLKDVADAARISVPYLSELERGRKEGSSEVLAAAARGLGLGLADLLSLAQHELAARTTARHELAARTTARQELAARTTAQHELAARTATRVTSRVGRGRTTSAGQYDGLCLAA